MVQLSDIFSCVFQYIQQASSWGSINRFFSWSSSSAWHWFWLLRALLSAFTFPFAFAHSDYLVLVIHWCINSAGCFWTLFVSNTVQQEEAKLESEADFHVRQSTWRSSALLCSFCSHQVLSVANDLPFRRGIPSVLTSQSNLSPLASALAGQQVTAGCVLVSGQLCWKRKHQTSVIYVPSLALKHFPVTQGKIELAGLQDPGPAMLTKELHPRGLLFLARWYMRTSGFYCLMYSQDLERLWLAANEMIWSYS